MASLRAWVQASRPLAQGNIAPGLFLGQAFAWSTTGQGSWGIAGLVGLFGVLDQLLIVYANDYADRDADPLNDAPTAFSGGSRVLVEGKMTPRALLHGAWVAAGLLLALTAGMGATLGRPLLVVGWALGVLLVLLYSFAPARLAYRGGGELVQGAGVGVVLPLVGYYAQAGSFAAMPWAALGPTFLLGMAGNVVTAVPDVAGDAKAGKRTWPVTRGVDLARRDALVVTAVAAALVAFVGPRLTPAGVAFVVAPAIVLALFAASQLGRADRDARGSVLRYVLLTAGAGSWVQLAWTGVLFACGRP